MSASEKYDHALTPRQQDAYDALPGDIEDIAASMGISKSSARDHLMGLREAGVSLSSDEHGIYYDREQTREQHGTTNYEVPGEDTAKSQHTIKKKEVLLEMKRSLAEDLQQRNPVVSDGAFTPPTSDEDVVIHRSDDHIGASYTDEFGDLTYGPATAIERVEAVTDKTMKLVARQKQAGISFDTAHLIMGGDTIHGEGIHANQPWESAITLVEQIEVARDLYVDQIERLRDEFEHVQVVCQNGNHGELRGDGMSEDANADDIVYMMLEKTAHDREWDDVTIITSDASYYTNFRMRVDEEKDEEMAEKLDCTVEELPTEYQSGHRVHVRHGQNSLLHIGTSSGKKRWYNWLQKHQFDIAYRGHYHEFRVENISSRKVVMSGSISPPSDFEDALAEWSEPAATVHGASDSRPMTWMFPIDFREDDQALGTEIAATEVEPTAD